MTAQQSLFTPVWRWKGLVGSSSARFSPDRRYRYELRRVWKPALRPLVVVLLNPSKADELDEDPTVRRLLSFANDWGCGSLVLANAFALCSTDPAALRIAIKAGQDAVGPENDATLRSLLRDHASDKLLLGWGHHGHLAARGRTVATMALTVHGRPECFGLTQNGQPWHPLFLPSVSVPHLYADLARQRAEASR